MEQLSLTVNFKKVLIYNTENEKKLPKFNIEYFKYEKHEGKIKRCPTVVMTGLCNNQYLLLFPDLPSALCQIIVASTCGS